LWCISLIASKLNNKSLDSSYQKPFLYSLITNNQLSQFNQLADSLGFKAVNFTSSVAATGLNNPYQIVYRINSLSVKSPDVAYSELGSSSLDKFTRQYLYNQVADNLAIKQMFSLSLNAMKQGSQDWISDDEYEWQVRSYLYANNWSSVLATINAMPDKLQSKSSWLYWKAYAAGKLGQNSLATQTLQKIPSEYNYYSLLAQAELQTPLNIDYQPETNKLSQLKYANDVKQSFALYQTAKDINSSILTRIATNSLYYVIKNSNDADIAAISKRALSLGWNDMSIYAANHLQHKSATMSFPLLFTSQYKHYAGQNNIPPSYPMAVTRQESRFNPNALAWDGGVGLMQIMPATAAYIAKKLKSSNCFKNYECNIQFGTWFLAHLVTKFGNNPIYAAAGYNAGPGRAHRWQQVFQDKDNRVQIELIPFNVTRDYVQKVVSNKLIYDALLQNNQSVNMLAFLSKINNKNVDFIVDDDDTNGDASGSQQPQ
jgi:soluble lytic murein transglycosylase